jgi:predicted AlkP superfamily pyrophosphatase or phosphodiesterase
MWSKSGPPSAYADLGPDEDKAEHTLDGSTAFPHRIKERTAKTHAWFVEEVCASPAGLELISGAAEFLLEDAALGRDDVPDFLSVSFSSFDLVGHLFGPDSHEVRDMTILTDRTIAWLLKNLDETVGAGRYDLALSADHGIGPIPEIAARRGMDAGRINPDKIKLAVEAAFRERFGPAPEKEHWVARVLDSDVLLNRKLLELKKIALRDAQDFAAKAAAAVPNVAEAIPVHAIFDGGLTAGTIHDAIRRAQMESRSADVYVLPKPHYLLTTTAATHGTPYEYDCRVPLFFFGPGFKRGLRSNAAAAPGSLAPTLARALGIAPPAKASYPALEDAIEK